MEVQVGYVRVPGGRLFYEVQGRGPPLALIHAGFLDRRMWDDQFRGYPRAHRVLRYDVRGFGRSDRPTGKYSDVEDLRALLDYLRVEVTSIVGVSNGGRIAIDFAATYPGRVNALVLVGSGVSGYEPAGLDEEKLWAEFEARMKSQEVAVREGRLGDAVAMDMEAWASAQPTAERKRLLAIALDNSHAQVSNPVRLNVPPDPPSFRMLGSLSMPTLILVGDRDVPAMVALSRRLHTLIPGSRFTVLEGADHIANTSRPREFDRAVLAFLSRATGRGPGRSPRRD